MRFTRSTAPHAHTSTRLGRLAAALIVSAALFIMFPANAAQAHHGFDDFDTDRLYYIAGNVSQVRWGDPHSFFNLTLESNRPADTPELALPEQLQAPEDSGPINDAPSYSGSHDALEVVIAPPTYTGLWGLDRPLAEGERVEAVGYIGKSHDDEFRPVVFWVEDGKPINQVLGSQLPARPLSVRYPENGNPSDQNRDATAAADNSDGTSPAVVWGTAGAILLIGVVGGALYLRARSRRA